MDHGISHVESGQGVIMIGRVKRRRIVVAGS